LSANIDVEKIFFEISNQVGVKEWNLLAKDTKYNVEEHRLEIFVILRHPHQTHIGLSSFQFFGRLVSNLIHYSNNFHEI
jgi:hypothetical protein